MKMSNIWLSVAAATLVAGSPNGLFAESSKLAKKSEFKAIDFHKLADFKIEVPEDKVTSPKGRAIMKRNFIPKNVKELDGTKVELSGYIFPMKVKNERVTEFLLLRKQYYFGST